MTQTQLAKKGFKETAARPCYLKCWRTNTAWQDAIDHTTRKEYTSKVVAQAIGAIVQKEGARFEHNGKHFRIFSNRRWVDKGGGKSGNVHFYWVQPSALEEEPICPSDTRFWQEKFDAYATVAKPTKKKKRQAEADDAAAAAVNSDQSKKPRGSSDSNHENNSTTVDLTQEQVDSSAAAVTERLSMQSGTCDECVNSLEDTTSDSFQSTTTEPKSKMLRHAWIQVHPDTPFPEELLYSSETPSEDVVVSDSSDAETDL